jgi:hypothetical protein
LGDVAERDDEVIVLERHGRGTEAGAEGDGAAVEVDRLDFAHDEVGARAEAADGRDDVGESDAAGDDFGEHGLVDPVVLAVDERDDGLAGAEEALEGPGGVDAAEAPAKDDDAGGRHGGFRISGLRRQRRCCAIDWIQLDEAMLKRLDARFEVHD